MNMGARTLRDQARVGTTSFPPPRSMARQQTISGMPAYRRARPAPSSVHAPAATWRPIRKGHTMDYVLIAVATIGIAMSIWLNFAHERRRRLARRRQSKPGRY
jgi:hypothetical protein